MTNGSEIPMVDLGPRPLPAVPEACRECRRDYCGYFCGHFYDEPTDNRMALPLEGAEGSRG